MNHKIIIFLFLIAVCQNTLQAQQVKGYVKDVAGKPIANAKVTMGYDDYKLVCDTMGYFSVVVPPKTYSVGVSSVGYLPNRFALDVKKDTTIIVVLDLITNQLEQVVVSGDREKDNIRKTIGIAQLNTKALKKIPAAFGETDLLRGLQMLPGVSTVGEASNGINVRGGSTDQNLMLLDETPIFNPTPRDPAVDRGGRSSSAPSQRSRS